MNRISGKVSCTSVCLIKLSIICHILINPLISFNNLLYLTNWQENYHCLKTVGCSKFDSHRYGLGVLSVWQMVSVKVLDWISTLRKKNISISFYLVVACVIKFKARLACVAYKMGYGKRIVKLSGGLFNNLFFSNFHRLFLSVVMPTTWLEAFVLCLYFDIAQQILFCILCPINAKKNENFAKNIAKFHPDCILEYPYLQIPLHNNIILSEIHGNYTINIHNIAI